MALEIAALEAGLRALSDGGGSGKPAVLIADTIRGRGLPSIQERADRWFCNFSHEEVAALLDELHGARQAEIASEALIVR